MSKEVVLCVSNAYQKKYYLNENFNGLPQTIRDELKIMCVLYTEDVGEMCIRDSILFRFVNSKPAIHLI